ncbi:MAG: nickel-dependent lactate racemase family protein [Candidatus Latescibacterota bacterium]
MHYRFPYSWLPPLEIPDNNLIGVFEAGLEQPSAPSAEIVRRALEHPIGAPPLEELARGKTDVLILCDDNTRYTPAHLVLPHVIEALNRGGVPNDRIRILIAAGTHRDLTREERIAKMGEAVVENHTVDYHRCSDPDELVPIGKRMNGVEFRVNRRLREADLVIGVGNIIPHSIKGYSGGSNIILPGVSGSESIGVMHWRNLDFTTEEILGVRDNPVRAIIDDTAAKAGLGYIVNTIVNNNIEILDAVAGAPLEAHREGTRRAARIFEVPIPEKADIVMFDAFQNDLDFWQAWKGFMPASVCVKPGGIVITVAECREGIAHNAPEVERFGYREIDTVRELCLSGKLHPIVGHHITTVYRVITENGRGILISRGITRERAENVGFLHAGTPEAALDKAFSILGRSASVIVLRHAGNIRPMFPV